ncbi:MAG: hypothetical protein FJ096_04790 [Deltaproteobacteria bacterium]|nr:hypothetical protein [Deltaproteobacteria bacterium]
MGWLDKLKVKLGVLDADDAENLEEEAPRAERRTAHANRGERPSLDGIEPASQQSLEDVLAAREAGDRDEMRRLLRELDRGRGLRVVLRAAAALEAGDEAELAELLPKLRGEELAWRLPLQLASVLEDAPRAEALRARAAAANAPRWALAWSRALANDPEEQRRGLVELLFVDPALARTVAARDLALEGAVADPEGAERHAAFAHGRQCVRRFGAGLVADVLDRARGRA